MGVVVWQLLTRQAEPYPEVSDLMGVVHGLCTQRLDLRKSLPTDPIWTNLCQLVRMFFTCRNSMLTYAVAMRMKICSEFLSFKVSNDFVFFFFLQVKACLCFTPSQRPEARLLCDENTWHELNTDYRRDISAQADISLSDITSYAPLSSHDVKL